MLRRFRRGNLDSAVFTAATKRAIWRGPAIELPTAEPTIVGSRPVRAEVYAACLPPAPAGAAGGSSVQREVREFVAYSAKADSLETPDIVSVPPTLKRCEEMWAMPPARRCACMLRALGRAIGDDHATATLDVSACAALGPVALTALR